MATRPVKKKAIPKTAAQKAAEKSLYLSQQTGVEQTRARGRTTARGYGGNRTLRAGGTSLQQYDMEKFKGDPFPGQNGGGTGAGPGPAATTRGTPSAAPGRAKDNDGANRITKAEGKKRVKAQKKSKAKNERRDSVNSPNVTEARLERERLARAKAAAVAEAKRKRAAKLKAKRTDSDKGNSRSRTGGGIVQS